MTIDNPVIAKIISENQFYLSQGFKVVSEQADEHTGHQEYTMSSDT